MLVMLGNFGMGLGGLLMRKLCLIRSNLRCYGLFYWSLIEDLAAILKGLREDIDSN
jgi:hypothetical protein